MTNRDVLVRLRLDPSAFIAGSKAASAAVKDLHNEIDKSNDRTAWLAQGILALAPAAVRMGAGAVPAISGIATQLTVAVAAAGTAALAFNGVGDALGALNDYQLEPSAANMEKLALAMDKIGPAGEDLVRTLDSLGPTFNALSDTARAEMFPGVIDGLEKFMVLAPQFNRIVAELGSGMGQLASEAGGGLSSERFADFFDYLENDAKPILVDMGRTMGNFADGLLNMLVAFGPLSADFSTGLLEMSRSFVAWSEGLESSKGFQDFVSYVREAGPQTLDFLGSLVNALVALATALAPLGELSLTGLTAAADTIAALAATPIGPIALGFLSLTAAWGRLNAIAAITGSGLMSKAAQGITVPVAAARKAIPSFRELGTAMQFAGQGAQFQSENTKKAMGSVSAFGKAAAPVAGQVGLLALAMSDYDDRIGLSNTTTLALAGSLAGPWGAAAGASVGLMMDMNAAAQSATEGFRGLDEAIETKNLELLGKRLAETKAELADQEDVTGFKDFFSDAMRDIGASGDKSALETYAEAVKRAEAELANLKNERAAAGEDKALYNSLVLETDALRENVAAMRAKRDAAALGMNTELDYASALIESRKAVKENSKGWDINTEKGNENRRVVLAQAAAWNEVNRTVGQSPAQAARARAALIETATQLGATKKQAREYARELLDLPTDVETKIGLDWETARAALAGLQAQIANVVNRKYFINIGARMPNLGGMGPTPVAADGTTVPDSGKGYADRFLYLLADNEEVVSNRRGQASKYRPVLKAINADMPPSVVKGMLAGGGTAGDKENERRRKAEEDRKDREEAAKQRAQEKRDREEEKRNRRLDAQRTRDLLNSSLSNEGEQQNLEVQDARRRLRSAVKAGRPQREIDQARLELKTDRNTRDESRDSRERAAKDTASDAYDKAVEDYWRAAEEALEHERKTQEAILDGQQAAVDKLMDAADAQLNTAKETAREWAQAMERAGASATAGYRNKLFSDSAAAQQSGLRVGPNEQAGGGGWRSALTGDISGLNERSALIAQLKAAGLSGSAMEALLAEGTNDDVRGMIARGEIAEYARMFAEREALQGSVSAQAGYAAYGAQASAAQQAVAGIEAQVVALQARLAEIAAQRPISVYEAVSAEATAAEVARQLANAGAV